MRPLLAALVALLAVPATAAAKEGAMFDPQLASLTPGRPTAVRLFVMPMYRDGRVSVPAPPAGAIPVVTLRSTRSGRVVRFTGGPLRGDDGSGIVVTLPRSRRHETWRVSVRAAGRTYGSDVEPQVSVPGTGAPASLAGGRGSADGGDDPPAWALALGAAALAAAAAAVVAVARRRAAT